jgi:phosphatidylinositol-3-phosphatase
MSLSLRHTAGLVSAVVLAGALSASPTVGHADAASTSGAASAARVSAATTAPTKVLTFIEENSSYSQMRTGMPYLFGLASRYGYASNWAALTHPSLPNYLAIAGGSTFGVTNDAAPATNAPKVGTALSVFDQALNLGKTAKTYAESMTGTCALVTSGNYAVKHNPWAYFGSSRARCRVADVPLPALVTDAANGTLPNAGMVIPNLCSDAHNCSLQVADNWLKTYLPKILATADFTSGRLVVVITADEDNGTTSNKVLTVVLAARLSGKVVTTALTHYSLTRYYAQVLGAAPLRGGATAPDMKLAFGL